ASTKTSNKPGCPPRTPSAELSRPAAPLGALVSSRGRKPPEPGDPAGRSPSGRPKRSIRGSIAYLIVVHVLQTVAFDKPAQFVLKAGLRVVRFLGLDVFTGWLQLADADREDAVAVLPAEFAFGPCFMHPLRAVRFEFSHHVGQRVTRRHADQQVHVVGYAARLQQHAIALAQIGRAHV